MDPKSHWLTDLPGGKVEPEDVEAGKDKAGFTRNAKKNNGKQGVSDVKH